MFEFLALIWNLLVFAEGSVSPPLSAGGPYHNTLVDQTGNRVRLACVNWYGAHMQRFVVNGLDKQPLDAIAWRIKEFGFNCVRLVFSNQLYAQNPVLNATSVAANPRFVGWRALAVFDATVEALTYAGLMVVLNNHISTAGWCCSEDDGDGLWYTKAFPAAQWKSMWVDLADRYKDNKMVVGADLRNELRRAGNQTPEWGSGRLRLDWHAAAQECGNDVLAINPQLIIIVEGLSYSNKLFRSTGSAPRYLTDSAPRYVEKAPVRLTVPDKLVYSGHVYGWDAEFFENVTNYTDFVQRLFDYQLYVMTPVQSWTAPFWLGEFGDNTPSKSWNLTMQLLCEHPEIGWSYWALDGYQSDPSSEETFGIFNSDYKTVRHPWKLRDLQRVMGVEACDKKQGENNLVAYLAAGAAIAVTAALVVVALRYRRKRLLQANAEARALLQQDSGVSLACAREG